jgi:NADPH:quinone reductase-like Zn-dependent oxidoreductase
VSAPEDRLVPVPDGVDDVTAAAVGVPAVAGWMAVGWRGALAAGERVLVLGASGVAGQVAVSAARLGGAGAVVAAGRSARGLGHARAAGAAAVVDLTAPDLPGALRAACPDGVDLVVDMLWGEPLLAALPLLRPGGRIVQVGNAAAPTLLLPAGPLRGGRLDLRGYSVFSAPFADVAAAYVEVARAAARGEVVLHVEVVPLEGARAAWARLAAGTGGMRIVLVP